MELSLQKLQKNIKRLKVACVPLMLAIILQNAQAKEVKEENLAEYGKEAVRFINVSGTVKDSKGEPLPGVTVIIKGTKTSTSTDVNGVFRLNLPTGNEILVFKFLGFESKEMKADGGRNLVVILEESTSALDEVVVTGYGSKKRSEIVGSVATISGKDLEDIPAPTIAAALRGRIAGLSVGQVSGKPGASITLNVRNSTVSAQGAAIGATTEPLYIIDGITVGSSDFNNLDASMVENITILKDASAAIYGAAGAKGVVLVTTKKGKLGKPSITYNGYVGVSDAARTPDMLSGYDLAKLINDGYEANGSASSSSLFSAEDLEYIKTLRYKNWYDEVWSAATMQRHNLSISGGKEKTTFFVGGSYQGEDGNYKGLKQDRYSFRSGLTTQIVEGLNAELNFNVNSRVRRTTSNSSDEDATFFQYVITRPDWYPISLNGQYVNPGSGINPLALLNSGYFQENRSKDYRINASLNYSPTFLKGFTAKVQISQAGSSSKGRQYQPPYDLINPLKIGNNSAFFSENELNPTTPIFKARTVESSSLQPSFSDGNSYQGFFTLKYGNTFGLHSVDLTVGGEQTVSNSESLSVIERNQQIPGSSDLWAFKDLPTAKGDISNSISESTKRSFFGRFSYDWDKKYLLEAVARLDASSNFATGHRWGLSPSIGLGWILSKEDFFKNNVSFVNFLKLKVNYGITGDDRVSARLWQERYLIDTNNGYLFGSNNDNSGINPSVFPNLDITWEKKKTINLGIESSWFNDKLDLGVEFFRNKTYDGFDQGAAKTYPFYAGFIAPAVNYREYYNWGSEFNIGYKTRFAKDLNFGVSMNFAYGNSVVDKMIYSLNSAIGENAGDGSWLGNQFGTDPRKYNSSNIGLITTGMFRTQEQVDAFLAENPNYKIYGQTPQPGWLNYEDTNGDGIINDYDMAPIFEKTNPFFSSGISLDLSYKNLSLSTNIAARLGGKVFYDGRARTKPGKDTNVIDIWKDHWSVSNPDGKYPRFDDPSLSKNSDFWAVDGTMIRINNMTLSYKVPTKVAQKLGLGSARILATGNNLWTIVNPLPYKDPYTNSAYDYPTIRTISLGLSVNL